jgi:secreted trypsin-like serine protease
MFLLVHPFDMESQTLDPGPLINSRKIDVLDTLEPLEIVGGIDIDIANAPFCAILRVNNTFTCSAVIISEKYVLTAAHCLYVSSNSNNLRPISQLSIVAGSSLRVNLETGSQQRNVSNVIIGPNYDNIAFSSQNDIGILELSSPLCFTDKINPIQLTNNSSLSVAPSSVEIFGYGRLDEAGTQSPNLKKMSSPIMDFSTAVNLGAGPLCFRYISHENYFPIIPANNNSGRRPSFGDSGGPSIQIAANGEPLLIGITSHPQTCDENKLKEFPTWMVNVPKLFNWIQSHTGDLQRTYINSLQGITTISEKIYSLSSNLTVENGNDLTITGFGALILLDNLTVPPGSKINLYGEISGYNAHCRAQGISVYGINNNSQFSSPGQLTVAQGQINTFMGSEIKYCKDGVSLISGGIGKFVGTLFTENINGVKIEPYENFRLIRNRRIPFGNLTSFSQCAFMIGPSGPNPNKVPSTGITMNNVSGIAVSKSLFKSYLNELGTNNFYTIGIDNISGGLLCKESCNTGACPVYSGTSFEGLRQGILFNGTTGSNHSNIVSNATFDQNEIGVNAVLMNGSPEIYLNRFIVPGNYTPQGSSYSGVQFFGESAGWKCEQNEFIYSPFFPPWAISGIGSFCNSVGVSNNNIRNNKYTSLRSSNLANGVNGITNPNLGTTTGLNYDCNQNFNSQAFDFATDEIRSLQFTNFQSSTSSFEPTYNKFSFVTNPNNHLDFSNSGTNVKYYFRDNAPIQDPNYAQGVSRIPVFNIENDICPNKFCFGNCGPLGTPQDEGTTKYNQIKNQVNEVIDDQSLTFAEKQEVLTSLDESISQLVNQNILKYLSDTSENESINDSLLIWYDRQNSISGEIQKVSILKKMENHTVATSVWNNIPNKFSSLNQNSSLSEFVATFSFLVGRSEFAPFKDDSLLLESLRTSSDKRISFYAIGLLSAIGTHYTIPPVVPEYSNPEQFTIRNSTSTEPTALIFPNPAKNSIVISSPDPSVAVSNIRIVNTLGSEVFNLNLLEYSKELLLEGFLPGIYFLQMKLEDGSVFTNPFIKQ